MWTFKCVFADGKLIIEAGSNEGLPCGVRCKTQRHLDYHIQASHTEEGLRNKLQSETKLAEFFNAKGCPFDRDRVNSVSLVCKPKMQLMGSRCFPDFYLLALSAKLGADVIVGLDEHGHRQYPCDLRRTLMLASSIGASHEPGHVRPMVYVRFNPHYYHVDNVLRDRPLVVVFEELWKVLSDLTRDCIVHKTGINLIYVNYDQFSVGTSASELWRSLELFAKLDEDPSDVNKDLGVLLRDQVIGVF